jgi:protein subunit release factor A
MTEGNIWEDLDIRITDQRIGMGAGGFNTIMRVCHKPTGIVVEIPRTNRGQYHDRQMAVDMIEYALSELAK